MTHEEYIAAVGTEEAAVRFENFILQMPKPLLPPCACDVLDGRGATPAYWAWLAEQFRECDARPDHDQPAHLKGNR